MPAAFAGAAHYSIANAQPTANVTPQRLLNADAEQGAWLASGRDYRQSHYSPLTDINKENVRQLGFAWDHEIDYFHRLQATPLVVDGMLFTTGMGGAVYALDAKSGARRWSFNPNLGDLQTLVRKSCCGPVNRGVAIWRGKVYVASFDGFLHALDAGTGALIWKVDTIVDRSRTYTISAAPYIAKELVVIGNSGADLDARGYITAYDHATGKQAWRFFTVPGDPRKGFEHPEMEMAAKTWDPNSRWDLGLGGTVWDGMSYDPILNLLYVGTGNGTPWPRSMRSPAGGDNLFLASILAINPDNGRLVWHYQTVPGENWDYSATQKTILADLTLDGKVRQVLMQAPKNGFFYILDRKSGELLSASPFAKITWASHVDLKTGRPVETGLADYSKEPKLVFPGAWGGHNWPPMAFNPKTGLVYIPVLHIPVVYSMPDRPFVRGQMNMSNPIALTVSGEIPIGRALQEHRRLPAVETLSAGLPNRRTRAYLKAWDPVQERVVWEVETHSSFSSFIGVESAGGVMTSASGLVFQGRGNGQLIILDAETGDLLHTIDAGISMMAAPMTYKIDGTQYVAIMGADLHRGRNAKGRIVAFKLAGGPVPQNQITVRSENSLPAPERSLSATAEQITRGGKLFTTHCATCHASGRAPDLARMSARAHAEFMDIVLGGSRLKRGMGDFSAVLSGNDAQAIHAYVRNLALENDKRRHAERSRD